MHKVYIDKKHIYCNWQLVTPSLAKYRMRQGVAHRRRMYTEETAKVVAAAWGTECIQFLATLAVLHQVRMI